MAVLSVTYMTKTQQYIYEPIIYKTLKQGLYTQVFIHKRKGNKKWELNEGFYSKMNEWISKRIKNINNFTPSKVWF